MRLIGKKNYLIFIKARIFSCESSSIFKQKKIVNILQNMNKALINQTE